MMQQTNSRPSFPIVESCGNLAVQQCVQQHFEGGQSAPRILNFDALKQAHIEGAGGWPPADPCTVEPHTPESPSDSQMLVYAPRIRRKMVVLVCETLSTYLDVRDLMKAGQRTFFGQRLDGVAYGSEKVLLSPLSLSQMVHSLGNENGECFTALGGAYRPHVDFLYWGSIDRTHVLRLLKLYQANPGVSVRPFVPAYCYMLDAAYGRRLPRAPHGQQSSFFLRLEPHFTPMQKSTYRLVLMDQLRIPQGIVTKRILHKRAKA